MSVNDTARSFDFTATSPEDTATFAAFIARCCDTGSTIALRGDLGAGKTEFARSFIQALCDVTEVPSPTFTLVQTYTTTKGKPLMHYDLYRLEDVSEMQEIGLEDALEQGITLIEWPEIALRMLPSDTLDIHISQGTQEQERRMSISGAAERWRSLFSKLEHFPDAA